MDARSRWRDDARIRSTSPTSNWKLPRGRAGRSRTEEEQAVKRMENPGMRGPLRTQQSAPKHREKFEAVSLLLDPKRPAANNYIVSSILAT
jgi:hypothetical protein